MMGRRLEYQSLKAVLLHMDAGVRIQISLHMPSIGNVEKRLPLKVKHFFMNSSITVVDKTKCQVGIIRHYPDGNAPAPTRWEQSDGGSQFDFDEFGFQLPSGADILLPGDVSFQGFHKARYDSEEDERRYRFKLRNHEKALEILNELTSKGVAVEDYLKSPQTVPFDEEEDEARWILEEDSDDLPDRIEEYKLKIQPFECRRNNTKPPFTCYIQLTIRRRENEQIQLFEYNKKLFEAAKQLNKVLFGGRIMPIQVERLISPDPGICRLPVDFRLQVNNAYFKHLPPHKNVPLIVENLENVNISDMNALIPTRLIYGSEDELLQHIKEFKDLHRSQVCIIPDNKTCSPEFYIAIIQAWLIEGRPVGARLWMKTGSEGTARDALELILSRFEKSERNERCITIDLSDSTRLEVSYALCKDLSTDAWMLKTLIVRV